MGLNPQPAAENEGYSPQVHNEYRNKSVDQRLWKSTSGESFASLWESWRDPQGDIVRSCTIITTVANDLVRPIHDRMPVILSREMESFWLDHDVVDPQLLQQVLVPYPSGLMDGCEVSPLVNRPGNDGPEVVLPMGVQSASQGDDQSQPTFL